MAGVEADIELLHHHVPMLRHWAEKPGEVDQLSIQLMDYIRVEGIYPDTEEMRGTFADTLGRLRAGSEVMVLQDGVLENMQRDPICQVCRLCIDAYERGDGMSR